ncbi:MAG: hypothetical protein M0023_14440 [Desulfobacteraceae bacterium]|nr:hypothetical protein [Desulfobacteraceae bacterium]
MKKSVLLVLTLLFVVVAVSLVSAAKGPGGTFDAKPGDVIYVCGCGAGCDCGSLAKKEGTCSCGNKLVKTTVNRVEKGRVYYSLDGKELSAPMTGKYACGCGSGCDCGSISQKPGKCACDRDMVKVGPAPKAKK